MTSDANRLQPGTAMALVAMGLGVLVIANDFTALNVALPSIEEDFDSDVSTVQWVVNAYALVFGMVLVTGGRLADMFGRRRVFFIGSALFAGFSLLGGLAPNVDWLIGARVGMGVGGAMMWPAILGMTYAALPASKAGLAGGLILGAAGTGNAIGPLVGGALSELESWRWIFFLNVPIAALAAGVTWLKVHQPHERAAEQRIDYGGIVSLSLGLVLLLLALDQATDWGWGDPRIVAMLGFAVAAIVAFGFIEPRAGRDALIPRDVFSNRPFRLACLAVGLMSAAFFSTVLYVPQFLQKILDYSPLEAGVAMLPMLAAFGLVSFAAGPLYGRLGAGPTVITGAALVAIGPFLLSLVGDDSSYGALVPGLVVTGAGIGAFYSAVTTFAITALDPDRSSLAGGLIYMFQVAGGAVGLGATTAIFTSASQDELARETSAAGIRTSEQQESVIHGVLAGTESGARAVSGFSAEAADRVLAIVRDTFVSGLQVSFRVIAAAAALGVVLAILAIVRRRVLPGPPEAAA